MIYCINDIQGIAILSKTGEWLVFSKVLYTRQRTELPPRSFSKRFRHCEKTMLEKEAMKRWYQKTFIDRCYIP